MTFPEETTLQPVTLTPSAAAAAREVMSQKNLPGYSLRLFISGSSCSGIKYGLALDNHTRAEDTVVETDGIKLIVDELSIKYLQGATVDYIEEPESSGFKITNPNVLSTCNCGQSDTSTGDAGESTTSSCSGCS